MHHHIIPQVRWQKHEAIVEAECSFGRTTPKTRFLVANRKLSIRHLVYLLKMLDPLHNTLTRLLFGRSVLFTTPLRKQCPRPSQLVLLHLPHPGELCLQKCSRPFQRKNTWHRQNNLPVITHGDANTPRTTCPPFDNVNTFRSISRQDVFLIFLWPVRCHHYGYYLDDFPAVH